MSLIKKLFNKKELSLEEKIKKVHKLLSKIDLSNNEVSMIEGVVSIDETSARDIMIPRVDVISLNLHAKKRELTELASQSIHSRIPVYNEKIDNIKGILHLRDLLRLLLEEEKNIDLIKHLTTPFFIPESRKVVDILKDLQQQHQQMAIVVDEYGGFSGIVTMENILEEIIGDVQDESDDEKKDIIQIEENIFSVDARTDLETINETLELDLEDNKADTIAGYLINCFGYVPKKGESIFYANINFKIKLKRGNSILRIEMELSPELASGLSSKAKEDIKES